MIADLKTKVDKYMDSIGVSEICLRHVSAFVMNELKREAHKSKGINTLYKKNEDVKDLVRDTIYVIIRKKINYRLYRNRISASGYPEIAFDITQKVIDFPDGKLQIPFEIRLVLPDGKKNNLDIPLSSFVNKAPVYYSKMEDVKDPAEEFISLLKQRNISQEVFLEILNAYNTIPKNELPELWKKVG